MKSFQLISELEKIPLLKEKKRYTLSEIASEMSSIKYDCCFVEAAVGIEEVAKSIFEQRNIPDDLSMAYEMAFADISENTTLFERYAEILEEGDESTEGFISNLKGKLFELRLLDFLKSVFPEHSIEIAENPIQQVFDISMTPSVGETILVQAKMGSAEYVSGVIERIEDNPDVLFAVSEEIKGAILGSHPELADQLIDVDISNFEFTKDVKEGLSLLADNLGLDIPDNIAEIAPYISDIFLGGRLLLEFIKTKKDFKEMEANDRRKLSAVRTILILSRYGLSLGLAKAGGLAGTSIGSLAPGAGNVIGAVIGSLGGATCSVILYRRLSPYFLEYAYALVGLSTDDIFYFKNKEVIDNIGISLSKTASNIEELLGNEMVPT